MLATAGNLLLDPTTERPIGLELSNHVLRYCATLAMLALVSMCVVAILETLVVLMPYRVRKRFGQMPKSNRPKQAPRPVLNQARLHISASFFAKVLLSPPRFFFPLSLKQMFSGSKCPKKQFYLILKIEALLHISHMFSISNHTFLRYFRPVSIHFCEKNVLYRVT